jgi:hypothetical protein
MRVANVPHWGQYLANYGNLDPIRVTSEQSGPEGELEPGARIEVVA